MEIKFSQEIKYAVTDTAAIQEIKRPWYKIVIGYVWKGLKAIFSLVCADANKVVVYIVNSPENQELARQAVEAAISAGLKGDNAWDEAMKKIDDGVIKISDDYCVTGKKIRSNIKDALLQLVYTMVKAKLAVMI